MRRENGSKEEKGKEEGRGKGRKIGREKQEGKNSKGKRSPDIKLHSFFFQYLRLEHIYNLSVIYER